MKKTYRYRLRQNGIIVAGVDASSKKQAEKEIQHYALIYGTGGKVQIIRKEIKTINKCKCGHVKDFHKSSKGKCSGQVGRCKCNKFQEVKR